MGIIIKIKKFSIILCISLLSGTFMAGCGDDGGSSSGDAAVSMSKEGVGTGGKGADTGSDAGDGGQDQYRYDPDKVGTRDNTPVVLANEPDGTVVYKNEYAIIDASHADQGYVCIKYLGNCEKVKVQVIETATENTYTYLLKQGGNWQAFPLSCGDNTYTIRVLENLGGDSYAISLTQDIDVKLENEFLPFLYPNQYVNFASASGAVETAATLAKAADTDLQVVSYIYQYVVENIVYDTAKAESVEYGYTPDVDATMSEGRGICFDYAAVMTAMLRSQGIPTRLDVGYSGEAYHAWISVYCQETGWLDGFIQFDGSAWNLLDPTLAANNNNNNSAVSEYIGDGSNYLLKYSY